MNLSKFHIKHTPWLGLWLIPLQRQKIILHQLTMFFIEILQFGFLAYDIIKKRNGSLLENNLKEPQSKTRTI